MELESILSIFLYIAIGAMCLMAAATAKKTPKLSFWFIVITLTLLAGFRHPYVGIDTLPYVNHIMSLLESFSWKLNNIDEPGFIIVSYVVVGLTKSYTAVLTVFAFITNYFMVKRLFELREDISFPWAIFIYICQYYFMTFNILRQWVAMAIVFYYSKYIMEGKKGAFKFILAVAVSITFHKTAFITLALLPLYWLVRKSRTVVNQIFKLLMIGVSPVVLAALLVYMRKVYGDVYGNINTQGLSFINVARVAFMVFIAVMTAIDKHHVKKKNDDMPVLQDSEMLASKDIEIFDIAVMFVGIVFALMTLLYKYADRLGMYFIIFEMIVLPRYIKNSKFKIFVMVFVLFIFMYLRINSFMSSGQGEMPYIPFWAAQ